MSLSAALGLFFGRNALIFFGVDGCRDYPAPLSSYSSSTSEESEHAAAVNNAWLPVLTLPTTSASEGAAFVFESELVRLSSTCHFSLPLAPRARVIVMSSSIYWPSPIATKGRLEGHRAGAGHLSCRCGNPTALCRSAEALFLVFVASAVADKNSAFTCSLKVVTQQAERARAWCGATLLQDTQMSPCVAPLLAAEDAERRASR